MRDEVFVRLLDAIVSGELEPGEQLHDAEIEKWAGASRTPVREALNQLASAGLVEVLPQSKTRVAPIDVQQVLSLVEMLHALFRGVVLDVVPLLTPGDVKELRAFEKDFAKAKRPGEFIREAVMRGRLLTVFVRRLDNRTIARLSTRHAPSVRRAIKASSTQIDRDVVTDVLHKIVESCASGDASGASDAIGRYFVEVLTPLVQGSETDQDQAAQQEKTAQSEQKDQR